jgi:CRP/FNR family transcriptional regulator
MPTAPNAPLSGWAPEAGEEAARQFGIPGLAVGHGSCDALRNIAVSRKLSAGEALFWEDDTTEHTYLLTDGVMKAYKLLPNGRSQIVRFPVAGEVIASTFCQVHGFTAEALCDCAVVQLPRRPLEQILVGDPVLMQSLARKIADEMQLAHKQILLLGRMPAIERVSHFLLDFAMRQHPNARWFPPDFQIELPMTRTDVADYLGLTIETVSRIFSRFRRDGLIDLPRSNLVVLRNHGSLREHSQLPSGAE